MQFGGLVRCIYVVGFTVAALGHAQVRVAPEGIAVVNGLFEAKPSHSLHCSIRPLTPFLNFEFRYEAGFAVTAQADRLGPGEHLQGYLRVTPQGAAPTLLEQPFDIPPVPPDMGPKLGRDALKKVDMDLSGVYAVGEGHYATEFLLVNSRQGTSCLMHWKFKTPKHKVPDKMLRMKPNEVAPIDAGGWDGELRPKGMRLTVLLDAAPIDPTGTKLYAWDRAFLLQTLTSMLKQLPCQSIRVVAFNPERQEEVYRQERFDPNGFEQLAEALDKMELATVSYKALRKRAASKFLLEIADAEASSQEPPDAVVFLGPSSRVSDWIPSATSRRQESGPRFYYFEYYPWGAGDFPDSIDMLTRSLHGTVFKIHSADELGKAIQKMQGQLQLPEPGTPAEAPSSP